MFYALGHIYTPPAAIVRIVRPAISGSTNPPASPLAASPSPSTVQGSVFEMPAGLPPFLKKVIMVPLSDQSSEFATLKSVSRQIGVAFSHTGPDYALAGTKVPFGKPVPSYEFLWYVGKTYIPGTVNINGSGAISAVNQKPSAGS